MHRRLFAPFLTDRGGSVCQCTWNEGGGDIEEAVPDLYKSIFGHPEWRAIILIHPKQNKLLPFDLQNPFDFAINHKNEPMTKKNPVPLICLTYMLAGLPSLGIKEYKECYACYNPKSCKHDDCFYYKGNRISLSEYDALSKREKEKRKKKCGTSLKPRYMEIEYTKDEKIAYQQLKEQYVFKENRPVEVLILTTREVLEPGDRDETREVIRHVWEFHDEEESSDFWKIYPNKCRFLCYDLINPKHTLYTQELWRFFLLAITLAFNQIPGQALQAYLLYKVDLKINTVDLGQIMKEQIEKLLSVQAIIQERLLSSPVLTQEKKTDLVPMQDISVKFEDVNEGDVRANGKKLGLASDCPISEKKFWREHIQGTKQTIDNILSAPQEIVANKALETRHKAFDFSGREQVLDRFQIDHIHKRVDELEAQVVNASVYGILDTDAYKAEVAEAGDIVRKYIGLRLTKRNILLISLCSLSVYLCGFIPYIINSAKIGWDVLGGSFGLVATALVLLAAGGLLILWFLRRRLMNKIKTYNKTINAIFDRVNNGSKVYSDYFSSVCTYMYARSLLSGVILKQDNYNAEGKIQKAHLSSLDTEIKNIRNMSSLYGLQVNDSNMMNTYVDVSGSFLTEMPSACQLYELTPNNKENTMELENTGETLNAPYSFIAGLSIIREEIYDKKGT
jgi:hypothetical protein